MTATIKWIVPEAPEPTEAAATLERVNRSSAIRVALLGNSKANADLLLSLLGEQIRVQFPDAVVLVRRKNNPALGTPLELLDQIASEADLAITAMAD